MTAKPVLVTIQHWSLGLGIQLQYFSPLNLISAVAIHIFHISKNFCQNLSTIFWSYPADKHTKAKT